jgi:hypothetical protein
MLRRQGRAGWLRRAGARAACLPIFTGHTLTLPPGPLLREEENCRVSSPHWLRSGWRWLRHIGIPRTDEPVSRQPAKYAKAAKNGKALHIAKEQEFYDRSQYVTENKGSEF